jgi:Amt family ammonium transporter
MNKKLLFPLAAAIAAFPAAAWANDPPSSLDDVGYIFTTLLFLIGGFLVFWMAAGFAMLEAGLVRSKNVTMQLTKNIALFSLAAIMYWLVGYNVMYPLGEMAFESMDAVDTSLINWTIYSLTEAEDGSVSVIGYLGAFGTAVLQPVGTTDVDLSYASDGSDYFFQLMFCATTASIVSGTLAERIKLWPFLIFVLVLTGLIYPIEASWQWGGGWLSAAGFSDFAGSTLVHAAGGFAALAGAIILGPRLGKYKDGKVNPMPGSNMPLATLGTFILWLGWFGFNGGSQLAMGTINDVTDVSRIFANTNMAAAAGAVTCLILTQIMYGKSDLTMVLNGALAGLVSITAEPLAPSLFGSLLTGAVGGVIVVFTVPLLDKLKIDDVVGAIPVHLFAGIWGTLAVAFYTGGWGAQILGIAAIGVFVFVASLVVWFILHMLMGIRVDEESEITGLDVTELGMEAYPEFSKG